MKEIAIILKDSGAFRRVMPDEHVRVLLEILTDDYLLWYSDGNIYPAESARMWSGALYLLDEIEEPLIADLSPEHYKAYIRLTRWSNVQLSPERQQKLNEVNKLFKTKKLSDHRVM